MSFCGYAGKIAYVDLDTGEARTEPLDLNIAKKFIGGWGIGWRLGIDFFKIRPEPFSGDNPIIINAGPLVGTLAPSAAKISVASKSPVDSDGTGRKHYIASSFGGTTRFGLMMKNAGYDNIIITGKAKRPSYLLVNDEGIKLCDAGWLWGKRDVYQTIDELAVKHGGAAGKAGVLAIGEGGENLVKFANAIVDGSSTLGKSIGGPVMGSKNLKAIVTYGTGGVKIHDTRRFLKEVSRISTIITKWRETTSPIIYEGTKAVSMLREEYRKGYAEEYYRKSLVDFRACTACPSACRADFKISDGEFAGTTMRTSHWRVLPDYGQRLRLTNYREMMFLIDLINRKGLDMFSTIQMITFLTRLFDHGEIGTNETGGLEMRRDFDFYVQMVEMIAKREGLGDVMAEGWHALSQKVGVNAFQHHDAPGIIKGSDANVDARSWTIRPLTMSQVTNPRGGLFSHCSPIWVHHPGVNKFNEVKKGFIELLGLSSDETRRLFGPRTWNIGRITKHSEDVFSVFNCLGICSLYHTFGSLAMTIQSMSELYSAATGIEVNANDLKKSGERVWNLYKLLNVNEGFSRKDDAWPAQWVESTETPARTGMGLLFLKDYYGKRVHREDLERMLNEYYDERSWDIKSGVPTNSKLKELEIEGLL